MTLGVGASPDVAIAAVRVIVMTGVARWPPTPVRVDHHRKPETGNRKPSVEQSHDVDVLEAGRRIDVIVAGSRKPVSNVEAQGREPGVCPHELGT